MSKILGPLFLTDQQLMTPKETGSGFSEISLNNKSKTELLLNLAVVGIYIIHISATTCLSEK